MSKNNSKAIRWLYRQLPVLTQKGLLSEEQAAGLRAYYGAQPLQKYPNLTAIVIGVLGTLLVGGGIILIVAYNWDDLPHAWRTVVSFAPLVLAQGIYGYVFFWKRNDTAWVEGASGFLFLMIGATMALISQTYHIAGTLSEYLLSWALLSIPLLYLMNASLPASLYLAGIAWWATTREGSEGVVYWALLGAAIPHLMLNLRPSRSPIRRNVLGWTLVLSLFVAWWWVVEPEIKAFGLIGTALVLSNLYLLEQGLFPAESATLQRPFRTSAVAAAYLFLLVLTFRLDLIPNTTRMLIDGYHLAPWAARINLAVLILLFVGYFYLFLSRFSAREVLEHTVWLLPFIALLYVLLYAGVGPRSAQAAANLFILFIGVAFLATGLKDQRIGRVNVGMFFILLLAAVRFFDTDWSFAVKGAAFVVLGLAFLLTNWVLARRMNRQPGGEKS